MYTLESDFKPTVEWMREKYDELNEKLFRGSLDECDFAIFTTGRGSQGGVLGWFKMCGDSLRISASDRHIYKREWGYKDYVTRHTFVSLCKPRIELNGNYDGTEKGFLETLVHEMCHYYTYMEGYAPTQAHGVEFREIARAVSSRSNGYFTVQRVASAEQMSELRLNAEMSAKREKRLAHKKASATAILAFRNNGEVRLSIVSNERLINHIVNTEETDRRTNKVIKSNDINFIEMLFQLGYKRVFRTWRYWNVENNDFLNDVENKYKFDVCFDKSAKQEPDKEVKAEPKEKKPTRLFSIKTSNGKFECDGSNYWGLFKTLKERFPNMSDETINKIINNPANYREVMESRKTVKGIIREVLEELMNNELGMDNDESITITPDMNLGLKSPIEDE